MLYNSAGTSDAFLMLLRMQEIAASLSMMYNDDPMRLVVVVRQNLAREIELLSKPPPRKTTSTAKLVEYSCP